MSDLLKEIDAWTWETKDRELIMKVRDHLIELEINEVIRRRTNLEVLWKSLVKLQKEELQALGLSE